MRMELGRGGGAMRKIPAGQKPRGVWFGALFEKRSTPTWVASSSTTARGSIFHAETWNVVLVWSISFQPGSWVGGFHVGPEGSRELWSATFGSFDGKTGFVSKVEHPKLKESGVVSN